MQLPPFFRLQPQPPLQSLTQVMPLQGSLGAGVGSEVSAIEHVEANPLFSESVVRPPEMQAARPRFQPQLPSQSLTQVMTLQGSVGAWVGSEVSKIEHVEANSSVSDAEVRPPATQRPPFFRLQPQPFLQSVTQVISPQTIAGVGVGAAVADAGGGSGVTRGATQASWASLALVLPPSMHWFFPVDHPQTTSAPSMSVWLKQSLGQRMSSQRVTATSPSVGTGPSVRSSVGSVMTTSHAPRAIVSAAWPAAVAWQALEKVVPSAQTGSNTSGHSASGRVGAGVGSDVTRGVLQACWASLALVLPPSMHWFFPVDHPQTTSALSMRV